MKTYHNSSHSTGATYFLAKDPSVYAKLTSEIRTKFPSEKDITLNSVSDCVYLNATIEETLRVYPPSPANHTRMVPDGGAVLEGKHIPGGLCVGMPMYASFNCSSNWVHASRFAPERWTSEDPVYAADKKDALQPFSFGPRNCLGRHLAYNETRLALAKFAWHFDLQLCEQSRGWAKQTSFTFWTKPALMVRVMPARKA